MRLTKKQALAVFKGQLKENERFYNLIVKDKVALRDSWNNYTDSLYKDGMITPYQYNIWANPF